MVSACPPAGLLRPCQVWRARLVARLPPFELTKKNSLSRLSVVVVVRVLDDDHLVVMMIIPIAIHIAMVLMDDDLIFGLRGRGIGYDER